MQAAHIAAIACFVVAALAWIVAAAAALAMLRHRQSGRSRFWYATHGIAFFTGEGFAPGAGPHLRRFRLAAMVFFGAILAGVIVAILAIEPAEPA